MSEINMQKFLNTLWNFTGVKENKDNFIQRALKVCKIFKVKPLKTPKPDVPSKKTAYNLFCKDIRKTKKELQGVPVSKASAIISKEWKKVEASEKKLKKYKDLYEEERQQYEEAMQRYPEDPTDEMEIINLHKKCNKKAKKVLQPKKASGPPKSDEAKKASPKSDGPKKVSGSVGGPGGEEKKPKKASSNGKKTTTKAGKKARRLPEFIDSSKEEEEGPPKDDKEKKMSPLLWVKGGQSFFDL